MHGRVRFGSAAPVAALLLATGCGGGPDAPAPEAVSLEYIAHASWLVHSPEGRTILIDPYASRVWLGYDFPSGIEPDAVLITHPHYDHDAGEFRGSEFPWPDVPVVRGPGRHEVGDATVFGVEGKHADPYGEEFGQRNTIYVIETGGVRIAHVGDNGPLSPEAVAGMGRVDVLLMPADGHDHILSGRETEELIMAVDPRVVVPMHYRIPHLETEPDSPSDLGEVGPWLEGREPVVQVQGNVLDIGPTTLPDERTFMVFEPSPDVPPPTPATYAPPGTPIELAAAGYAKVLCSAVHVSGRDLEEARWNSGLFFFEPEQRAGVTRVEQDADRRAVHVTHGDSVTRTARFHGDQGCVIDQREGEPGPFFEPEVVRTALGDAADEPWPMGEGATGAASRPGGLDPELLAGAVDAAFADTSGLTQAFLVVHDGRIVAERYAPGVGPETQLESWSMGKSLTATLIGILIRQGAFGLDDPAPVPEWRTPGDPRAEITIRHLLNMSSGLRFIAPRDPDYVPELGYPDHMFIYSGAIDAFQHSVTRPRQFPPGTEGRYRNSDPLTLGYLVKRWATERGESYLTFPQRELFDRIGIRRQVLETDPYGNFLLTGYDYGTARNWARLGLLYLNDGVWMGERILPEGFVDFVSSPAPAWTEPVYGGQFWLNRTGEWDLPEDAYFMAGGGGQRTFIVPSLRLVVVRLGHFRGSGPGMRSLNEALGLLRQAAADGS